MEIHLEVDSLLPLSSILVLLKICRFSVVFYGKQIDNDPGQANVFYSGSRSHSPCRPIPLWLAVVPQSAGWSWTLMLILLMVLVVLMVVVGSHHAAAVAVAVVAAAAAAGRC